MVHLKAYLSSHLWFIATAGSSIAAVCAVRLGYQSLHGLLSLRTVRRQTSLAAAEEACLAFACDRRAELPLDLPRDEAFKEFLTGLSEHLLGDLKHRVLVLYAAMGFSAEDIAALKMGAATERRAALQRCCRLGHPLPDELWPTLLADPEPAARWTALDHLVAHKGSRADFWLRRFFMIPHNQDPARAYATLNAYAKLAPDALLALIQSEGQPFLTHVCLAVLRQQPVPGSAFMLIDLARQPSRETELPLLLDAIAALPDAAADDFVLGLSRDLCWRARLVVAKTLGKHRNIHSTDALERLSVDLHHRVRTQAVESLVVRANRDAATSRAAALPARDAVHPLAANALASTGRRSALQTTIV